MEALDMSADQIKVCCRIRPANSREKSSSLGIRRCIEVDPVNNVVTVSTKPDAKKFTYGRFYTPITNLI